MQKIELVAEIISNQHVSPGQKPRTVT